MQSFLTKEVTGMKRTAWAVLLALCSTGAYAGDGENIQACVTKAREFADVSLNEFEAEYQGNIFSMSTAKWKKAYCEVKLGDVYNLQVNGKEYIFNGYAGRESYALKQALDEKTDGAIRQLKSRIALLEQRMKQTTESLRKASPNHTQISQYIDDGIDKAIGCRQQASTSEPIRAQSPPNRTETIPDAVNKETRLFSSQTSSSSSARPVEACISRGIAYFKEIGSYPTLLTAPNAGRSADVVARERCNRTTTAF